ncbi:MAG: RNA-directed DNA polymerase [Ketobacter sp.]|nr:RNA-directed DNA polymerase [Ketobacter sp.]
MFDQSFSERNLRTIFEVENRKGNYIENDFFPSVASITTSLTKKRASCRIAKKEFYRKRAEYYRIKTPVLKGVVDKLGQRVKIKIKHIAKYKEIRERLLSEELQQLSLELTTSPPMLDLTPLGKIKGKDAFRLGKSAKEYFQYKQILYNLKKAFGVKQNDRDLITSQLAVAINGQFPKILLRTDISSFYESIERSRLEKLLVSNTLLDTHSKSQILHVLKSYQTISGSSKGVPRGVGISALLVEIYMKEFDRSIRNREDVIFYGRYVDDIAVVFDTEGMEPASDQKYRNIVEDECSRLGLNLNSAKTFTQYSPKPFDIEYLGYKFKSDQKSEITLELSDSRERRYKKKIDRAFSSYFFDLMFDEKKATRLLLARIRFLTGNTHLYNNKRRAMIGIYFTNRLVSTTAPFTRLDHYMKSKIRRVKSPNLRKRLEDFSFKTGFEGKLYYKFSTNRISEIVSAWEHVS